jgi:hypothetical protein
LARLGAHVDARLMADSEFEAVKKALNWAKDGDLLVLLLHDDRKPTMDLIEQLQQSGWRAGEPLPE